ncbi:MAG: hypothetical protein DI626_10835 [Micavibrio aeruginosavorus]|uniref:ADP-heptose--LPS heptosyltransferase n=1 Tax=Micavibrio aeruginosavorus TaxID=349221 RepID=A0A2W4ZGA6_9BACT|nr:MAG: hypothetical protein DI626_10835 [Micavibrio aeruginosavorus]
MADQPRNILVIKLGALGDFIQAMGPMAAIRGKHAGDRITLMTTAPYEAMGRACGYFDDVILDKKPKWTDLKGWINLRRMLNAGNFSRVYDLQNNDRTSFYLRLFSPRPEWVGAAKGASHRNASPERSIGRAFDGHVMTLGLAGIDNVQVDPLSWMKAAALPEGLRAPYVLIVPGSAPSHPEKRWPAEYYAALCTKLLQGGYQPVLIGAKAEQAVLQEIENSADGVLNLCGQTALTDIPALALHAHAAIGNDTGPMHLIAPTGCKTIVLFSGKTNPKKHAPLGTNVSTLQVNDLADLSVDNVWDAFSA